MRPMRPGSWSKRRSSPSSVTCDDGPRSVNWTGATAVAVGVVAGLHDVGEPERATVVGYAGPDTLGELAAEVLTEAGRLGLEVPDDAHERYWPKWTDLA